MSSEIKGGRALGEDDLSMLRVHSGISDAVVHGRGYSTVTSRAELKRLGFADKQCQVPALLLPIWSVLGTIIQYQIRPEHPRIAAGKPLKYELPAGTRMVLDVHPSVRHLLGNPNIPLWVTEGVKKGDALVSAGQCAVSLLGVWNWRGTNELGGKTVLPDWDAIALNERRVFLVFDSDVMLKAAVDQALARLGGVLTQRGAEVYYLYLPSGAHGEKVGVDDYLASGHTLAELLALASPDPLPLPDDGASTAPPASDDEQSQATLLVTLAAQNELFHDALGECYAAVEIEGHRETWSLRSTSFRRWLSRLFFVTHAKAPRLGALTDALMILEGKAQFEGEERQVWVRVAEGEDHAIFIDLGSPAWDAIRVTAAGWTVVPDPPVHFRRSPATAALPNPARGGTLTELRALLPLTTEADFQRIVGWLVGCLRPRGPYVVLVFIAEQGAGKSVTARFLRDLIDPSGVGLRGMPHSERDLVIAARTAYVLALDNVSTLPDWLSDGLCRLATGAGWATRQLYTDTEETLFSQTRPTIITGIDDFISNGDLLDRALMVNLARIPPEQRRREVDLERQYKEARPSLFGALLDAAVMALRNEHDTIVPRLPRMADFVGWVVAAEPALPWAPGAFLQAFNESAHVGQAVALEASSLAAPVVAFATTRKVEWFGTAGELLPLLEADVGEEVRRQRGWPKNPRALGSLLRRLAPALREVHGIAVTFEREETAARRRLIRLGVAHGSSELCVQTVQSVQAGAGVDGTMGALDANSGVPREEGAHTDQHLRQWQEVIT